MKAHGWLLAAALLCGGTVRAQDAGEPIAVTSPTFVEIGVHSYAGTKSYPAGTQVPLDISVYQPWLWYAVQIRYSEKDPWHLLGYVGGHEVFEDVEVVNNAGGYFSFQLRLINLQGTAASPPVWYTLRVAK